MEKGTIKSFYKSCTKAFSSVGLILLSPALGQGTISNSPGKAGVGPPEGQCQSSAQPMLNGENAREMPVHHHLLHATATIPIPGEPLKRRHRQIFSRLKRNHKFNVFSQKTLLRFTHLNLSQETSHIIFSLIVSKTSISTVFKSLASCHAENISPGL